VRGAARAAETLRIEPVEARHVQDLEVLFATDETADRCWCAWYVISVKDFHNAGRPGNRKLFIQTVDERESPIGVIAYLGDDPIGWCATGPRSRFRLAVKTPTLKARSGDDDNVWLVPCFYIAPGHRGQQVARSLLEAAARVAFRHGAEAVEGFPMSGSKKKSSGANFSTGNESLFASCGFQVDHRPSRNRVVMRIDQSIK